MGLNSDDPRVGLRYYHACMSLGNLQTCSLITLPPVPLSPSPQYRPLIEPGNERIVHHMMVYQCSGHDFSALAEHADGSGAGYRCYSENMPPAARGCRGVIAGWGVGGEVRPKLGRRQRLECGFVFGAYSAVHRRSFIIAVFNSI